MIWHILKTLAIITFLGMAMFVSVFVAGALVESGPSILGLAVNTVNSLCVGWVAGTICAKIAFSFKPERREYDHHTSHMVLHLRRGQRR